MVTELRRGTVRHVTMRAEVAAGRGWCSVAYFSLDGQPAVLVCEKLPPYSRAPLPAPFAAGDEMIVAGKLDAKEGRFDVACARLVRQLRIIDASQTNNALIVGLVFVALALVTIISNGPALVHGSGPFLLIFGVLPIGAVGIFAMAVGRNGLKARRMVETGGSREGL